MLRILFCALILTLPVTAQAQQMFQQTFAEVMPPDGYVSFCNREQDECTQDGRGVQILKLTPQHQQELLRVNNSVNSWVHPQTDEEHYRGLTDQLGKPIKDYWNLPRDGYGDCEDYVLQKRHDLIALGWPVSALLITVVRDETGAGHAVLTVHTNAGDFVLDNKNKKILLWSATPYQYVERQSVGDPNRWVSLDPSQVVVTSAPR